MIDHRNLNVVHSALLRLQDAQALMSEKKLRQELACTFPDYLDQICVMLWNHPKRQPVWKDFQKVARRQLQGRPLRRVNRAFKNELSPYHPARFHKFADDLYGGFFQPYQTSENEAFVYVNFSGDYQSHMRSFAKTRSEHFHHADNRDGQFRHVFRYFVYMHELAHADQNMRQSLSAVHPHVNPIRSEAHADLFGMMMTVKRFGLDVVPMFQDVIDARLLGVFHRHLDSPHVTMQALYMGLGVLEQPSVTDNIFTLDARGISDWARDQVRGLACLDFNRLNLARQAYSANYALGRVVPTCKESFERLCHYHAQGVLAPWVEPYRAVMSQRMPQVLEGA